MDKGDNGDAVPTARDIGGGRKRRCVWTGARKVRFVRWSCSCGSLAGSMLSHSEASGIGTRDASSGAIQVVRAGVRPTLSPVWRVRSSSVAKYNNGNARAVRASKDLERVYSSSGSLCFRRNNNILLRPPFPFSPSILPQECAQLIMCRWR